MEFCGLTDSPARVLNEPKKCENCSSTSRLGNGLCLKCLLSGALDEEAAGSANGTFKETLAEVNIRDTNWRIGNYEILEEIGRGGMAVIYRARELHSERIVALKRVLSYHADSDQTLARFRREAETATRLDHPNIVPVYYVGESEDGLPFFTMKLARGGSLLQARDAFRREPRESVLLMAKVALAIQYAHGQGVLHRDLKPSNILLGDRWEPLVSDFGLARWIETSSDLTRTLTIFGTPGYIAPEQATGPGARLTVAADIYNLGAILFELLTGRPPFLGEHALAVLRQVTEKPAPRLRSMAPHLDRDLETICARCLEREPSARYHSAGAVARDLQNWLEGRPIVARPVGIPVRVWRWSRRNRLLASTLGVFLILAAASIPWEIRSWKLQTAAHENALARRSVAVLPFFNLDNVAADAGLAQSVANSLQHELDRVSPARIRTMPLLPSIGWLTAEQIRRVGETAKTRTVLTGTARTVQGKKRISVRLFAAGTGEPLLVRVWEGNGQEDPNKGVAKEIGGAVHGILSAKDWSNMIRSKVDPGLRDQIARDAILAGRDLMFRYTTADLDRAIDLFKKALNAAPDSSLAHSYLASAATGRTHYIGDWSYLELGKAEAAKAVRLSPDSGDAHRALAGVYYQEGRFNQALEEAIQTVETSGVEEKTVRLIGMTFDALGHPDRALNWFTFGSHIRRTADGIDAQIGDCWAKLCDDKQALQAYNRAAELQPDCPQGGVGICHIRLLEGNFAGARELVRKGRWNHEDLGDTRRMAAQIEFFARNFQAAEKLYGDLAQADLGGGGSFYGAITYRSALGCAWQALGDNTRGKALLEHCLVEEKAAVSREPENPEVVYRLAAVESSLGMTESALEHLHAAVSLGWIDYRSLAMDPRFDALRQNLEFRLMLKNVSIKVADMRVRSQLLNAEEWRSNQWQRRVGMN